LVVLVSQTVSSTVACHVHPVDVRLCTFDVVNLT
jgi:hypothetical protein